MVYQAHLRSGQAHQLDLPTFPTPTGKLSIPNKDPPLKDGKPVLTSLRHKPLGNRGTIYNQLKSILVLNHKLLPMSCHGCHNHDQV